MNVSNRVVVGVTKYPAYPVETINLERCKGLLEGRVYGFNKELLQRDLRDLESVVMRDRFDQHEAVSKWIENHDGDYVVVFVDSTNGRVAVLNDCLGRLPVYIARNRETYAVSREIGFVLSNLVNSDIENIALAEYLLFGFCLSDRTPFGNVRRLRHATLLRFGFPGQFFQESRIWDYNLEEKNTKPRETDYSETMSSIFVDTCRKMSQSDCNNILSLSGGLDSRAVGAGLKKAGTGFEVATFRTFQGANERDVAVAEKIAAALGVKWKLIDLPAYTGEYASSVLRQKCGIISIGMAYDVPFMQILEGVYGSNTLYFSGDGGDKLLPRLVPSRSFSSVRDLAKYIVERNAVIPLAIVAMMCRLTKDELLDGVAAVIEKYPECSLSEKYARFLIQERGMKWLFEGEDRNRIVFWSCTPFYSLPFFRLSISCPDGIKRGHGLYRSFLRMISREVAEIVDANRGSAITSPLYRLKMETVSALARNAKLLTAIKRVLRPPVSLEPDSNLAKCLRRQIEAQSPYEQYFDLDALRRLLASRGVCTREMLESVVTITLMIERLRNRPGSLEPLFDEAMI
jgi:asparagine synthase (glutamine-hydrolysing)